MVHSGALPLGTLLSSSRAFFREYRRIVLTIAVTFGILMAPLTMSTSHISSQWTDRTHREQQGLISAEMAQPTAPEVAVFVLCELLLVVLAFLSQASLYMVVVQKVGKRETLLHNAPRLALAFGGVAAVMLFFMYVWVPMGIMLVSLVLIRGVLLAPIVFVSFLATIILGIVNGPHVIVAPYLYLTEKKGIKASVRSSMKHTKGYWGKIVGNMIVLGLLSKVAVLVFVILLGLARIATLAVPLVSAPLIAIVMNIGMELIKVFQTIFMVQLAETIVQHPH